MIFIKDPDAVLDYTVDWTDWLGTDTINTSTWILPVGATLVRDSDTKTGTSATAWLSGGTLDKNYSVINRIVTVGGRTEDRTILIKVRQH